jgi:pimeloyl-ACP methyl ester carboxylesterase
VARPLPILLVHGFNGDPWDWTGGRPPAGNGGLRRALLIGGELDPDLVRLFRYGIAADGTYNNRGDLRQIASRLSGAGLSESEAIHSSVDRLSADSVARGGPPEVTLIAHSLGGIICRYYLSRSQPDEFGTLYGGKVGRLIQIGAPNRGVDLLRLTKLVPANSLPWQLIRALENLGLAPALPGEVVEAWDAMLARDQIAERARIIPELSPSPGGPITAGEQVMIADSPILHQLDPDGTLLANLNRAATMPDEVECHTFYGDILVNLRVSAGRLTLLNHTQSFGDLTVTAFSAKDIPGAQATPHAFITEKRIALSLRYKGGGPHRAANDTQGAGPPTQEDVLLLAGLLPDTTHGRLLVNPAVHEAILSVVGRADSAGRAAAR